MTALAFALALLMGLQPESPQPPVPQVATLEPGPAATAVVPPAVESTVPAPTTVVPAPEAQVQTPGPALPDVEFDGDEQRAEVGAWPSPLYRCDTGGVTDAAQLASLTGLPVAQVTASLDQNCERL